MGGRQFWTLSLKGPMQDTLNQCIQEIRKLVRKARTMPVDGLYLDEAGDIQDRLLRVDATCLEILARIDHQVLDGIVDNPRPAARFNHFHQRRAEDVPGRHELPPRGSMDQQFGHTTLPGENPEGEAT